MLDYLIEYGSSDQATDAANWVFNLRYTPGWAGEFCEKAFQGDISGTTSGIAQSLSDHNAVVSSFNLPQATASSQDSVEEFNAAFDQFNVQAAACGQANTKCVTDSNCCRSPEYSFDGNGYQCNMGVCERAKLEGEICNWIAQGSECLGYNSYNTGQGLHCESGICVKKYRNGQSCLYDHECDSGECSIVWRWWGPSGKKCE